MTVDPWVTLIPTVTAEFILFIGKPVTDLKAFVDLQTACNYATHNEIIIEWGVWIIVCTPA